MIMTAPTQLNSHVHDNDCKSTVKCVCPTEAAHFFAEMSQTNVFTTYWQPFQLKITPAYMGFYLFPGTHVLKEDDMPLFIKSF